MTWGPAMGSRSRCEGGTAVVTGATGGIGQHLVQQCQARGMGVVALGRNRAALSRLTALGATCFQVDLLAPGAVAGVLAEVQGLNVNLLINCAGRGLLSPVADGTLADQREIARLNFEVPVELTHGLLPQLESARGSVLNMSSLIAFAAPPGLAMLSASKAALLRWSLVLRDEMRKRGVTVTTFCPGLTRTGFLATARMIETPLSAKLLMREPSRVSECAMAAVEARRSIAFAHPVDHVFAACAGILPRGLTAALTTMLVKRANG